MAGTRRFELPFSALTGLHVRPLHHVPVCFRNIPESGGFVKGRWWQRLVHGASQAGIKGLDHAQYFDRLALVRYWSSDERLFQGASDAGVVPG
jgi:hypothetical protein